MLPVQGTITTRFDTWVNYRITGHPTRKIVVDGKEITQWLHEAIDIVTQGDKPIVLDVPCTVQNIINKYVDSGTSTLSGFGNELWLLIPNGDQYRFCHIQQNSFKVQVGQEVPAGTVLAYTGRSGYHIPATVYHTHWEQYRNGKRIDPLTNQPTSEEMTPEQEKKMDQNFQDIKNHLQVIEDLLRTDNKKAALEKVINMMTNENKDNRLKVIGGKVEEILTIVSK